MSFNAKELIYALRGVDDDTMIECCGCESILPASEMLPEEGGDWVCRPCWDKWEFWSAFGEMFPFDTPRSAE